jgi:hypothetical protein
VLPQYAPTIRSRVVVVAVACAASFPGHDRTAVLVPSDF